MKQKELITLKDKDKDMKNLVAAQNEIIRNKVQFENSIKELEAK